MNHLLVFLCIDMRSVKNIKVSMRSSTPEEISPHHTQTDVWISGYILIADPGISGLHLASLSLIRRLTHWPWTDPWFHWLLLTATTALVVSAALWSAPDQTVGPSSSLETRPEVSRMNFSTLRLNICHLLPAMRRQTADAAAACPLPRLSSPPTPPRPRGAATQVPECHPFILKVSPEVWLRN